MQCARSSRAGVRSYLIDILMNILDIRCWSHIQLTSHGQVFGADLVRRQQVRIVFIDTVFIHSPLTIHRGWSSADWTSSDDRVRGGASQSYLDTSSSSARFHGTLDITALGGAGFASQRTTGEDRTWDLSKYSGIHLDLGTKDGKKYTFLIKDEILPVDEGGREQSTISYE
jgi:hypothetical protein